MFYNFQLMQTGVRDAGRYLSRVPDLAAAEDSAKRLAVTGSILSGQTARVGWWKTEHVQISYRTIDNPRDATTGLRNYRGADTMTTIRVSTPRPTRAWGFSPRSASARSRSTPRTRSAMSASRMSLFRAAAAGARGAGHGRVRPRRRLPVPDPVRDHRSRLRLLAMEQRAKALQLGARLAAVSDPISSDLKTYTGLIDGGIPGAAENVLGARPQISRASARRRRLRRGPVGGACRHWPIGWRIVATGISHAAGLSNDRLRRQRRPRRHLDAGIQPFWRRRRAPGRDHAGRGTRRHAEAPGRRHDRHRLQLRRADRGLRLSRCRLHRAGQAD